MSLKSGQKFYRISLCAVVLLLWSLGTSAAADKQKIQQAISKAQAYLLQGRFSGGSGSIAAMAYIKSGGDKKSPKLQPIIDEILRKAPVDSRYRPTSNHNYEASVDLMLLEAIDPEGYRIQIQMIVDYLLQSQQPNGAWFYDRQIEADCGDTSITQYAIMALWAASRMGIDVPTEVWEKAARWHIDRQRDDGGFVYHPFDRKLYHDPEHHRTTDTMTTAGTSSLLIIRRMLFDDFELDPEVRPPDATKRFGVLERFVDGSPPTPKGVVKRAPTMKPASIDNSLKESIRWMGAHFGEKNSNHERWFAYHLYSIERVAALMDVAKFGSHDWYDEGADELLKRQAADGSWTDHCGAQAATAMGLMFLSKATTTIVAPRKKTVTVGGGLQAGGRGLPDQLDAVTMNAGVVSARKIAGPVDQLLIELEKSSDAKVEDVQAAIVETVQLSNPEELIGQTERLLKLTSDPRVEVRRTVLWALGRSGNFSAAKQLIAALTDPEPTVVREASLALCVLTRRFDGCGTAVDPLDDDQMGLKEDSSEQERKAALDAWKAETSRRWTEWYEKNRPYDERDDRKYLKKNNR
ncbi:HEAT repeat domain-containing protein [Schlesneria sp. DSM 10557]|uniref:HEAT repeat domain-containing protein n=1 Tax=Schlesneria sp. DSM 10557 TaxID=3044399 RepID=UPI00359F481E